MTIHAPIDTRIAEREATFNARDKAISTGMAQRDPCDPEMCWAWKISYRHERTGRNQLGERFYACRAEAEQSARDAMRRQKQSDAKVLGKLTTEVQMVRTTVHCLPLKSLAQKECVR